MTGGAPSTATEMNGARSPRLSARLEANGVVVKFRTAGVLRDTKPSLVAVDQVSVATFSGHTISIVGQSGSGKSTLLKVLAGPRAAFRGRRASERRSYDTRQPTQASSPRHL